MSNDNFNFKDKISGAINDLENEEEYRNQIDDIVKREQDRQYIEHNGSFGGPTFPNIDGNGKGHGKSNPITNSTIVQAPIDIPDKDYFEFIVNTTKKTVRKEDILIRQIHLAAFSADLDDPINLGIMAPTSEGKTYPPVQALSYHPEDKIWYVGSMSPKVLIRQKGTLVDSNNDPIVPKIRELRKKIRNEKDKNKIDDLEEEIKDLYSDSRHLIDLTGITLVFLEPPHYELWQLIKPILSHDKFETTHDYVDTDKPRSLDGSKVQKVITRGFPACIFCSAKDESKWDIWPEIQSRFLITSPNMVKEKYEESTVLIAQRKGLPSIIRNQAIISRNDVQLAKQCVSYLKQELRKLSENKIDVWIPYYEYLAKALKTDKGTDVRNNGRIFDLLNTISLIKSKNRSRLCINGNTSIIADLEDLSQVLAITQNLNGIPAYKMKFFKEVFWSLFKSKTEPNKSPDKTKEEESIAVTTKQLTEHYKSKLGKIITSDGLKKIYLNELHNNGLIEEEESKIDGRQKIYKPLISIEEQNISNYTTRGQSCNFLQHSPIIVSKNFKLPPKNWLELQILAFTNYRIDQTRGDFIQLKDIEILNHEGNKEPINGFMSKYESLVCLIRYFQSADFCSNYNKIDANINNNEDTEPKDVQNYTSDSQSCNKIFSEPLNTDTEPEPQPSTKFEKREVCPNCDRMIDPFDKNIHAACCQGVNKGSMKY